MSSRLLTSLGALLVGVLVLSGCEDETGDPSSGADTGTTDTGVDESDARSGGSDGGRETGTDPDDADDGGGDVVDLNCAPSGDYIERREKTNNAYFPDVGSAESSSVRIGPGDRPRIISGCIRPSEANAATVDDDHFAFEVTDRVRLRAKMSWKGPGVGHSVAILQPDREPIAWWSISTERSLSTRAVELEAGRYLIHVSASNPAPSSAYTYRVSLEAEPPKCRPTTGAPDYTESESNESESRSNDAASITWQPYPVSSSTAGGDSAEKTGWTLDAGARRSISGESAKVETAGDSYLDRDAYRVTTGMSADELIVDLKNSSDESNLDVYVLPAGSPDRMLGSGMMLEAGEGDRVRALVEPNRAYWIWVAARDWGSLSPGLSSSMRGLPANYRLTLCAR